MRLEFMEVWQTFVPMLAFGYLGYSTYRVVS